MMHRISYNHYANEKGESRIWGGSTYWTCQYGCNAYSHNIYHCIVCVDQLML